jgi:hypothetical protein
VKEVRPKRLCTVWFSFCEFLEKGKTVESKNRSLLPGPKETQESREFLWSEGNSLHIDCGNGLNDAWMNTAFKANRACWIPDTGYIGWKLKDHIATGSDWPQMTRSLRRTSVFHDPRMEWEVSISFHITFWAQSTMKAHPSWSTSIKRDHSKVRDTDGP